MALFKTEAERTLEAELREAILQLKKELANLRVEREAQKDVAKYEDDIRTLRERIETLRIEEARVKEEHEKEKREVEHMVGLERKRQEFEIEQAKKEASLAVREENLAKDRERFEEQMRFNNERFETQVEYLKSMFENAMSRVPTVAVEKVIELTHSTNGNGKEPAHADK